MGKETAVKKEHVLGILFFGTLWGASEAILGGVLYRAQAPHASVPLTIIGFVVLTVARAYFPRAGSSTLIATCAMLYKFFNAPFFACHLLGILLLGLSYDVVYSRFKMKSHALSAVTATYLGYALFAVLITYVFRYSYWIDVGLPKVLRYVGISGTIAAAGNALLVPLAARAVESAKTRPRAASAQRARLAAGVVSLVTVALWVLCVTVSF